MGIPDLSFVYDGEKKAHGFRVYLVLGYIGALALFVKLVPLMLNPAFFDSWIYKVAAMGSETSSELV
jgi:hypothetical protein